MLEKLHHPKAEPKKLLDSTYAERLAHHDNTPQLTPLGLAVVSTVLLIFSLIAVWLML